ncbi:hypothetical protein [Pseudoalteromonas rubra]|uniref:hypothetical protein n=1 Tax=Pseudoalteromonas rubra TaxID=43658 RepID=UPI000F7B50F0|nr:hypothetical protein [Pseudoalteromonas rubra]
MRLIIALLFFVCFSSSASTTWIPIKSGSIIVFLPFIPNYPFEAPKGIKKLQSGNVITITWDDIKHASKYLVQAVNSRGEWVDVKITTSPSLTIGKDFDGFYQIRIVACNYYSCEKTGDYSESIAFKKSIIFVHPDILGSPIMESTL